MILSIDPGVVSIGICLFNEGKIIHAEKLSLVSKMKDIRSEMDYVDKIYELIHSPEFKEKYVVKTSQVVIEKQMRRNMIIVQMVFATVFKTLKKKVSFIAPLSVKTWFRGFRITKRNGHKKNKTEAVRKCKEMFPEMKSVRGKVDDICDAILMAAYFESKTE